MPDVKWKRGILWTLVHLGLKGGVSADDYDSAYRDPVKWDLLDLFTIKKLPYQTGIKASRENYCGENNDNPDGLAYQIKRKAQISVPTDTVFGPDGFPLEFSILATVRVKEKKRAGSPMSLFSLMDETGLTQFAVEVDDNPRLIYRDGMNNEFSGTAADDPQWQVTLDDGKWHKVAWSVYLGAGENESIAEPLIIGTMQLLVRQSLLNSSLLGEDTARK